LSICLNIFKASTRFAYGKTVINQCRVDKSAFEDHTGKFSVNTKMNDFVGNILQNKFYAHCYILLPGTRPKIDAPFPTALLLHVQLVLKPRCCQLHTALNSPHPVHAADGHYIRNSSCI